MYPFHPRSGDLCCSILSDDTHVPRALASRAAGGRHRRWSPLASMNTTVVAASAVRKVFLRLVPFSMLLTLVSLLDRTNISFGALQMNQDLGLSPSAYGVAASILFLGYCPFEIPSNLILVRVGARRWLARIMISWGIVVGGMAFVSGTRSLYLARFLLGA